MNDLINQGRKEILKGRVLIRFLGESGEWLMRVRGKGTGLEKLSFNASFLKRISKDIAL